MDPLLNRALRVIDKVKLDLNKNHKIRRKNIVSFR